nr:lantibiotic dehydratase [Pantoea multigeneris]
MLRLLEKYAAIKAKIQNLQQRFCQAVEEDIEVTSGLLRQVATQPDFRQALALAAPSLVTSLNARDWNAMSRKKRHALEKSLFSFFIRATMKTSPFSSFGITAAINVAGNTPCDVNSALRTELTRHSVLNRSIVVSLREALYQSVALFERNLPLVISPGLLHESHARGRARQYQLRQGMLWAEELTVSRVPVRMLKPVLVELDTIFSPADLLARLEAHGYTVDDAKRLIRQMLRQDAIRPAIQWNAHDPAPATTLANALKQLIPELPPILPWHEITRGIALLEQQGRQFSACPADDRPACLQSIQQQWQQLHRMLDTRSRPAIRTLVFEDVKSTESVMTLSAEFIEKTGKRIARVLASCAHFSMDYLWLHQRFIQRFGIGGECHNVADFIDSAWQEFIQFSMGYNPETWQALHAMSQDIAVVNAALPLTVYCQTDARDYKEVMEGTPRVVVNLAYSRSGWQSARSTSGGDEVSLARGLNNWLKQVSGEKHPVVLSVSGESSNLQAHARLSERALCLDETAQSEADLCLSKLRIRHNPVNGLLELTDHQNLPLHLHYIGGSTPMAAWGPKYLLIALSEPVQIGRPGADMIIASDNPETVNQHLRHQPRLEIDNCVLIRETWWIRASWLKKRYPAKNAAERVAALLDLFEECAIPQEIYVHGQHSDFFSWEALAATSMRKPMWCRVSVASCASYLFDLARDAEWLVLREALPSPSSPSWCQQDNRTYVSEFMLEMNITRQSATDGAQDE